MVAPLLVRGAVFLAPKLMQAFGSATKTGAGAVLRHPVSAGVAATVANDLATGQGAGTTLGQMLPKAAEATAEFAQNVFTGATGQQEGHNGSFLTNMFNQSGSILGGMSGPGAIIGGLLGFMMGDGFFSRMMMMAVGAMIGQYAEQALKGAGATGQFSEHNKPAQPIPAMGHSTP